MGKTITIGVQLESQFYQKGTRVSFVVGGEVKISGTIDKIISSGHFENWRKNDFIIIWDDGEKSRFSQEYMKEYVKVEK